ncbi:membrane protein [Turicibacter faecis]|uniref:Membrane protein n=1 Tax=Turicibacter faecis TaxID=2963365 RepID=A0ABN6ZC53_9FIRM|nr:membrane protein [Turicibacter sp. TC023]
MLSLIGIFIIIIGFILKIDTLAIVVIAGIATGFVGGLDFNEILTKLGEAFVANRYMTLFIITLPVIGLMERYGLKERAAWLIGQLKNAKADGVLSIYLAFRLVMAALSIRMSGHVQFGRPLVLPMAEGATRSKYKEVTENDLESIKGLTAAAENYGNFFGQNLFIGASGVMLIVGTLTELGIPVDEKQGPTTIALYTLPIALLALIIGIIQFRLNEKRRKRMHEALESKGGK